MSETAATRGIVLCHGEMAIGLVDAVREIAGDAADALVPMSNRGCSPDALASRIQETLCEGPAILFTDLQVGSCGFAARRLCRGDERLCVIAGVNLPLLVDFVMHRDMSIDELVPRLVEKGRTGISANQGPAGPGHDRRALSGR